MAKSECLHDLDDNMNYFGHSEISLIAGEDVTAGNVYTVMQPLNYILCFEVQVHKPFWRIKENVDPLWQILLGMFIPIHL